MKNVFITAVICLVVCHISAGSDLERRLRDLTESETPLAVERGACPVQFEKVGCYNDQGHGKNKVLNELLLNDRKPTGKGIDWRNFGFYLDGLTCRCAQAAQNKGYTHFGTQYYGECFSAPDAGRVYARDGASDKCVNHYYQTCNPDDSQSCVGKAHANFVYKIKEEGSGGGPLIYE